MDSTLETLGLTDPETGKTLTVEDVFADWAVANFLNDSSLDQVQYGYKDLTEKVPIPTGTITWADTRVGAIPAARAAARRARAAVRNGSMRRWTYRHMPQVRFEYITDAALSYESVMLDDISVPEINYTCGFEKDTCGWDSKGFARMDNVLPQTFVVQFIHQTGGQTTVERLPLDTIRQGSLSLNLKSHATAILVISGTAPFTTEEASFRLEIK